MVQRLATLLIGIGCLLAFIFDGFRWMSRLALALTTGSAIFGAVVADHHIWIQHLPPEDVPACGPSFDYLLETLPMNELISIMLHGDGNCADVSWMGHEHAGMDSSVLYCLCHRGSDCADQQLASR